MKQFDDEVQEIFVEDGYIVKCLELINQCVKEIKYCKQEYATLLTNTVWSLGLLNSENPMC